MIVHELRFNWSQDYCYLYPYNNFQADPWNETIGPKTKLYFKPHTSQEFACFFDYSKVMVNELWFNWSQDYCYLYPYNNFQADPWNETVGPKTKLHFKPHTSQEFSCFSRK